MVVLKSKMNRMDDDDDCYYHIVSERKLTIEIDDIF